MRSMCEPYHQNTLFLIIHIQLKNMCKACVNLSHGDIRDTHVKHVCYNMRVTFVAFITKFAIPGLVKSAFSEQIL